MGKKLIGSFPNHDGLFAHQIQIQRNSFFRNRQQIKQDQGFFAIILTDLKNTKKIKT